MIIIVMIVILGLSGKAIGGPDKPATFQYIGSRDRAELGHEAKISTPSK
jgi:hypothetical protein